MIGIASPGSARLVFRTLCHHPAARLRLFLLRGWRLRVHDDVCTRLLTGTSLAVGQAAHFHSHPWPPQLDPTGQHHKSQLPERPLADLERAGWGVDHPRNTWGQSLIHRPLAGCWLAGPELNTDNRLSRLLPGVTPNVSHSPPFYPFTTSPGVWKAPSLTDEEAEARRGVVTPLGPPSMN